jgi:hypothetical protein
MATLRSNSFGGTAGLVCVWVFALHQATGEVTAQGSAERELHKAAERGEVERVRADQGVPVDATDKDGGTALYVAADRRRPEVAQLLVERGAKSEQRMPSGFTPPNTLTAHFGQKPIPVFA